MRLRFVCLCALIALIVVSDRVLVQELDWAAHGSGPNSEEGRAVAVDAAGNSYVAGRFWQTVTFGAGEPNETSLTSAGLDDVFVAKYDPAGALLWVRQARGPSLDLAWGIGVDAAGDVYVTGHSSSSLTFAPGEPNETTLPSTGVWTMFLAKYDSGGSLIWARQAAGNGIAIADDLAVDASGNSYVTGRFNGPTLFGGAPAIALTPAGLYDVFVAKYDASGNVVWAKRAGGAQNDDGLGIAVDGAGNTVVTGSFAGSATFGPGEANETTLVSGGSWDAFVAAYDGAGSLQWARRDGGSEFDEARDVAIDTAGNSYVTGRFIDAATFGTGEAAETLLTSASAGSEDIYVARYGPAGTLVWARRAGGTQSDAGEGIAVDLDGNSYVTGQVMGAATFSPGNPDGIAITGLGPHLFLAQYDVNGMLLFARQPPTTAGRESGLGIALDASGSSYVTGTFSETATFGPGFVFTADLAGFGDMFLARFVTPSNTAPSMLPAPAVTRQQATPAPGPVTLATVSDSETTAGDLVVTALSVPSGLVVGPIANVGGTITTTVQALCSATVGMNAIALEVSDGALSSTAEALVDVAAHTPPWLGSYPALTVGAGSAATVVPAGPPSDNGSIATIGATASGGFTGTVSVDAAGAVTVTNAGPSGVHTIWVTATDDCGASAAVSFTLTVDDVLPPVIESITPSTSRLWPPNHRLIPVSLTVVATDDGAVAPVCTITGVTSNEPQNGRGDGHTAADWSISGPLAVALRSERAGIGGGRVYTVTVTCTDTAGNAATGSTTVTAPKSAR